MKYANLLNLYIKNSGLTLDELVKACDSKGVKIHPTYISKLRAGQRQAPSEEISKALAEICGHDPKELIDAGYFEKTPSSVLEKVNQYKETIDSLKPALFKILTADKFLNEFSNIMGQHISASEAKEMLNRLPVVDQIKLIKTAGFSFNAKENNGKVDFWLENTQQDDFINQKSKAITSINKIPLTNEHIINLPVYGEVRAKIGGHSLQKFLGTKPWMARNDDFNDVFMLKVKDDSMYPRFFPEDFAIVRPQHDVNSGEPAIVIVDDEEGLIKRVRKVPNGFILHSDNQLYEDREFYNEDANRVHIIAKVIDIKPGRV